MNCPSCRRPMVLRTRRSDGHQFWGCSGYPVCSRTLSYVNIDDKNKRLSRDREIANIVLRRERERRALERALAIKETQWQDDDGPSGYGGGCRD